MITQKFKGDETELKMEAAGKAPFDACSAALDDFMAAGFDASPFLLGMYDDGRMPFSSRVPRDSFVSFIREAIVRFPFTGTFESYIFILQAVFGAGSDILFEVPAAGKIQILVNASASITFGLVVREFTDGAYVESDLVDESGNIITASAISGIDSEFALSVLLAELIPAGVYPDITLAFFALFDFIDSADNAIVDHLGNQIVFIET